MQTQNFWLLAWLAFMGLSASTPAPAEAALSLKLVLHNCEQKTIVYGKDENGKLVRGAKKLTTIVPVSWRVFMLPLSIRTQYEKGKSPPPDFLLSTILTYRTETSSQDDDAAFVIEAAYKRAFSYSKP